MEPKMPSSRIRQSKTSLNGLGQILPFVARSGGLRYYFGPGDVEPGWSAFAHRLHIHAYSGGGCSTPLAFPVSQQGFQLCNPIQKFSHDWHIGPTRA